MVHDKNSRKIIKQKVTLSGSKKRKVSKYRDEYYENLVQSYLFSVLISYNPP